MTRDEGIAYGKRVINLGLNDETQAFCELAIKALEQESKADKALNLLVEWVTDCDFGYDNIPEEYEKYKDDIAEMGYREGLVYIVKMESEAKE